jgi:hypothetical protein
MIWPAKLAVAIMELHVWRSAAKFSIVEKTNPTL